MFYGMKRAESTMADRDPRRIYPPPITGHLQSKAKRAEWLRVRRDDLRSTIAVLERGGGPPPGRLETLRTELAGVDDELRALGT